MVSAWVVRCSLSDVSCDCRGRVLRGYVLLAILLMLASTTGGCATWSATSAHLRHPAPGTTGAPSPLQWLGTWRGTLLAYSDGKARELVPFELRVASGEQPAAVDWCLVYGVGPAADVRNYRLVEVDRNAGHYVIDEGDGIELQARLADDTLVAVFAVTGSTLVVRYIWRGDHIDFELESAAANGARTTGNNILTWERPNVQRARLWRQP